MPWISAAGAVASSVIGGMASSNASGEIGAGQQASAAEIALQKKNNSNILAPYTVAGAAGVNKLSDYLGLESTNPEYTAAKNAYNTALSAYNDAVSGSSGGGGNWNSPYQPGWMNLGGTVSGRTNYSSNGDPIALKKALDAAKAKMDATQKYNAHSDNFGSLLDNFDNEDFVRDPGYEFRLAEGEKGINRATAARGGWDSGATLKALAKYNQDFASNEFGAAYGRDSSNKGRTYDFLSGVADRGANTSSTKASLATSLTSGVASGITNSATQKANYGVMGAEALNNGIQGGIGNYLYQRRTENAPVVSASNSNPTGNSSLDWYYNR